MFSEIKPNEVEGWKCVYTTNTQVDATMVANYLHSLEIEAQILNKRDSAYNFTVGDMAQVFVYVPQDHQKAAEDAIEQLSDESEDSINDQIEGA